MQDKLNQDSTWNMKVLLESNTIQDNKFWASLAFLNKIFPQSVFSSKARSFCGINLLLNKIDMNAYWGAQVSHYIACPFQCSMGVLISILACTYLGWTLKRTLKAFRFWFRFLKTGDQHESTNGLWGRKPQK